MTSDDNLPQMRVEIERLADAIDKLSMRIDNHQSMTDALYVELEEMSDKIGHLGEFAHVQFLDLRAALLKLAAHHGVAIDVEMASGGLYEKARALVIDAGKASTSNLQRLLGIGYSRAARLIDMLEERGVISAGDGATARKVLMTNVEDDEDPRSFAGFASEQVAMEALPDLDDEQLYEKAKAAVIESRVATGAYVQRRLGIGYTRTARLMAMLEERGVISKGNGARARRVLISA